MINSKTPFEHHIYVSITDAHNDLTRPWTYIPALVSDPIAYFGTVLDRVHKASAAGARCVVHVDVLCGRARPPEGRIDAIRRNIRTAVPDAIWGGVAWLCEQIYADDPRHEVVPYTGIFADAQWPETSVYWMTPVSDLGRQWLKRDVAPWAALPCVRSIAIDNIAEPVSTQPEFNQRDHRPLGKAWEAAIAETFRVMPAEGNSPVKMRTWWEGLLLTQGGGLEPAYRDRWQVGLWTYHYEIFRRALEAGRALSWFRPQGCRTSIWLDTGPVPARADLRKLAALTGCIYASWRSPDDDILLEMNAETMKVRSGNLAADLLAAVGGGPLPSHN